MMAADSGMMADTAFKLGERTGNERVAEQPQLMRDVSKFIFDFASEMFGECLLGIIEDVEDKMAAL